MRKLKHISLTTVLSAFFNMAVLAQAAKSELHLDLGYFNDNDRIQYLKGNAKTKVNGKFQPVPGVSLNFFITSEDPAHLLGKAITNARGDAVLFIPPSAAEEWKKSPTQSFVTVSEPSSRFEEAKANIDITKARINVDTGSDRQIIATLLEQKGTAWVPVKGVDLILAVKRMGGNLNVSGTPTYTTDSLGVASADFKQENLPGDATGNITLVARLDGSDAYGTITREKVVPWGVVTRFDPRFDRRTLYARRGYSPLWLGFIAYNITLAVWIVLIYLVFQVRKLKKLGTVTQ
jgi:hypothetical protein